MVSKHISPFKKLSFDLVSDSLFLFLCKNPVFRNFLQTRTPFRIFRSSLSPSIKGCHCNVILGVYYFGRDSEINVLQKAANNLRLQSIKPSRNRKPGFPLIPANSLGPRHNGFLRSWHCTTLNKSNSLNFSIKPPKTIQKWRHFQSD